MSDLLSAEEVGALLKAFAQLGEKKKTQPQAGSPRIRSYDFSCPTRVSYDGLKSLKHIHSYYSTTLSTAISEYLKVPAYSRLSESNQMPYREFWACVPDNAVMCEVSCEPIADRVVVQFSPSIADACLDILMGGTGSNGSPDVDFTSVDCVMFSRVADVLMKDYKSAWSRYAKIGCNLVTCQSASMFNHPISPNEMVMVFNYEVRVSSTIGSISICVLAGATTRMPALVEEEKTVSIADLAALGVLGSSVQETKVGCKAVLGRASLTIQDLTNLQPGDIVPLDVAANSDVELWINNKPAYAGSVGRRGSKVGIKINRPL